MESDASELKPDSVDSGIYFGNGVGHTGYPQDDVVQSEKTYEES